MISIMRKVRTTVKTIFREQLPVRVRDFQVLTFGIRDTSNILLIAVNIEESRCNYIVPFTVQELEFFGFN